MYGASNFCVGLCVPGVLWNWFVHARKLVGLPESTVDLVKFKVMSSR